MAGATAGRTAPGVPLAAVVGAEGVLVATTGDAAVIRVDPRFWISELICVEAEVDPDCSAPSGRGAVELPGDPGSPPEPDVQVLLDGVDPGELGALPLDVDPGAPLPGELGSEETVLDVDPGAPLPGELGSEETVLDVAARASPVRMGDAVVSAPALAGSRQASRAALSVANHQTRSFFSHATPTYGSGPEGETN